MRRRKLHYLWHKCFVALNTKLIRHSPSFAVHTHHLKHLFITYKQYSNKSGTHIVFSISQMSSSAAMHIAWNTFLVVIFVRKKIQIGIRFLIRFSFRFVQHLFKISTAKAIASTAKINRTSLREKKNSIRSYILCILTGFFTLTDHIISLWITMNKIVYVLFAVSHAERDLRLVPQNTYIIRPVSLKLLKLTSLRFLDSIGFINRILENKRSDQTTRMSQADLSPLFVSPEKGPFSRHGKHLYY